MFVTFAPGRLAWPNDGLTTVCHIELVSSRSEEYLGFSWAATFSVQTVEYLTPSSQQSYILLSNQDVLTRNVLTVVYSLALFCGAGTVWESAEKSWILRTVDTFPIGILTYTIEETGRMRENEWTIRRVWTLLFRHQCRDERKSSLIFVLSRQLMRSGCSTVDLNRKCAHQPDKALPTIVSVTVNLKHLDPGDRRNSRRKMTAWFPSFLASSWY